MRIYEELFIVRPDATDEEVDPVVEQLRGIITQQEGTLDKVDKWGVRRLAYRVGKYDEAQYILLQFTAKPETVKELERRLRVSDVVMKYITVRIDEKLKRIDKRKKAREKRAARKPVMPVSAPAVATPMMPGEGHGPVPGAPSPGAPAPAAPATAAPAPPAPAPAAASTPAATPEQQA
jgi:small subunit ribosomal protein S6